MIELVTNLQSRGQFVDLATVPRYLPYNSDLYRSMYVYGPEIHELIESGKDFNLYNGTYDIQDVIIDIDGHNNDKGLDLAKGKVKDVINFLMGKGVDSDNFLVWFSGGGFHVSIAASLFGFKPSASLPEQVRDTVLTLFPQGDNIYYPKALIRVGYSYNVKRKAWKIPLHHHELDLDIPAIRELAQSSTFRQGIKYDRDCFEPVLADFKADPKDKFKRNGSVELPEANDFINVVTCMHKLYHRGPMQGRRHTDMLRLASWMRRAHMPESVILDALCNWAPNVAVEEVQKIVSDIFTKDYRYGCNDKVRMEFCDSRCIFFANKNEGMDANSQEDMDRELQVFAMTGGYTTFYDLADIVGNEFKIYPGEFVVVSGASGLNKSAFVQQICVNAENQKILYISTEVDRKLMYRRFLQQATHISKEELMEIYAQGNIPPGTDKLKHIHIVDQMPNFERLTQTILQLKPTMVVLDVIEDIGNQSANDNIELNSKLCKQIAMSMGIIVIAVGHMRKSPSGQSTRKKTLDDAKGSSALVQKADKVILIEGEQHAILRHVHSGKARDEKPFDIRMMLNIKTFNLERL